MLRRITAPFRWLVDLITITDNLLLLLFSLAALLALAVVVIPVLLPEFAPFIEPRVSCTSLSAPSGGGARSMLAVTDDIQELELDLRMRDITIEPGQPLRIDVIFNNVDRGPIILFMPEVEDLIQGSNVGVGVTIEIRDVNTGATLNYGIPNIALPATFDDNDIHLLEGRNRCVQSYELQPNLPQGTYSISASYFNNRTGQLVPQPDRTIDPGLATQGVWASNVALNSPAIRFIVFVPTPTPIPQPAAP